MEWRKFLAFTGLWSLGATDVLIGGEVKSRKCGWFAACAVEGQATELLSFPWKGAEGDFDILFC